MAVFCNLLSSKLYAGELTDAASGIYRGQLAFKNNRNCFLILRPTYLYAPHILFSFIVAKSSSKAIQDFQVHPNIAEKYLQKKQTLILNNLGDDYIWIPTKNYHLKINISHLFRPESFQFSKSRGTTQKNKKLIINCLNLIKIEDKR